MIINQTEEANEEWRSCCLKVDKNAVKYFVQVGILSGLVIFSAVMLVVEKDCASQRNYSSLLMISLGTLIPSPKMT
jgi:hypothetical protein